MQDLRAEKRARMDQLETESRKMVKINQRSYHKQQEQHLKQQQLQLEHEEEAIEQTLDGKFGQVII